MTSAEYMLTGSEQRRLANAQRLGKRGADSVRELIDMLTDPSWVVRRAVVEALAAMGEPAVPPLCEVLRHRRDNEDRLAAAVDALVASSAPVEHWVLPLAGETNPAVVADAAQVLGRRHASPGVPTLVQLTQHADDNVAVMAIEALGRIGGRAAVEALIDTASSGNFFRIFPAINVLGRSGDPRVVEPLARLLANASYLPEAARALGRTGERSAVKPLIQLLRSSSDTIIRIAAASLWDLRQRFEEKTGAEGAAIDALIRDQVGSESVRRLLRVLPQADDFEACAICRLLGAIASPEAAPLLAVTLDAPAPVAACAAEALKKIGREAQASMLQAIREGSSARRKVLLPVVSRSAGASEVAGCLRDPDPEVRALACDTLARLGNSSVVPELFSLLQDGNMRVVHAAIAAIQALGTRQARELAVASAKSPNTVVRRSALRILAYFGDSSALLPLLEGLRDPDMRVREAALQGLPYLEDQRAVEALLEAARSTNERTRALAMRALGQVPNGDTRIHAKLLKGITDPAAWVRYYACQSLGRLGYLPAVAEIAKLLQDEAGQVRASAVEALSHLDSPEAHQALREAVAAGEPEMKRAALVGLGIAHRSEDLPTVLSEVRSPDISTRLVALSAVMNFESSEVLDALNEAASDPDEQIVSAAIGFLAGRPEPEATAILIRLSSRERTRERALMALRVPTEQRIAGLVDALEAADDELAANLIAILSRIGQPEARVALLSMMKSANAAARKATATVLAARRDPEMLALLAEASEKDPSPEVRQICLLLLRE